MRPSPIGIFLLLTIISSLQVQAQQPTHSSPTAAAAGQTEVSIPLGDGHASAYLIEPSGGKKMPAVLYLHWLGEPKGDKQEFLDEASAVAGKGVVTLLVDMAWAAPGWFRNRELKDDPAMSVREIARIKAALLFLSQRPTVDASRIAIVGHDFGGMYALAAKDVLSGPTYRVNGLVLIACTPRMSDWFFYGQSLSSVEESKYIDTMADFDPIRNARSINLPALFQFAASDEYISQVSALQLKRAYKGKTELRWYPGGHEFKSQQAAMDRMEWLSKLLNF